MFTFLPKNQTRARIFENLEFVRHTEYWHRNGFVTNNLNQPK